MCGNERHQSSSAATMKTMMAKTLLLFKAHEDTQSLSMGRRRTDGFIVVMSGGGDDGGGGGW